MCSIGSSIQLDFQTGSWVRFCVRSCYNTHTQTQKPTFKHSYVKLVPQDGSDVDSSNVVMEVRQSPWKRSLPSSSSTVPKKKKKTEEELPSISDIEKLPGYVFEEIESNEEFAVLSCVDSEIRYVSSPPSKMTRTRFLVKEIFSRIWNFESCVVPTQRDEKC